MESVEENVAAIVNPVAGRKRGARLRDTAIDELKRLFPGIELHRTEAPGHGTELARRLRDSSLIIAVGGDGTVREVSAGLIGARAALAVIPTGSGNDFNRTVGIPTSMQQACRVARDGTVRWIDVVQLTAETAREQHRTTFANAAGFGFDARVAAETKKLRRLRGLALYGTAVFKAVRSYTCPRVRIRIDDRDWTQHVLLLAVANGRYYGGGMKIAPDAEPDDGQFDICIIDEVGKLKLISCLPSLIRGTHGSLKEVSFHRSSTLDLEFQDPVPVQVDGDLLDVAGARRFRLELLPRALAVKT